MPDQTYLTKRLLLRPPKPADAADVYRNIADWDVVRMIARPPWPYPRSLADEFVRTSSASVIEYKGEVIGAVGIAARSHGHNLGFWLGKRYWGQGFMTEAVRTVLPFVFNSLWLHRLEAACLPRNVASTRVLERNGFVKEGIARRYLKIDGRWQDHVLYATLADDSRG